MGNKSCSTRNWWVAYWSCLLPTSQERGWEVPAMGQPSFPALLRHPGSSTTPSPAPWCWLGPPRGAASRGGQMALWEAVWLPAGAVLSDVLIKRALVEYSWQWQQGHGASLAAINTYLWEFRVQTEPCFKYPHFLSHSLLVWLQAALFQRKIKICFHSRMLWFFSFFSCFSPRLEVSVYFGWFAVLSQLSLCEAEPFGRGSFLEVDCLLFPCCSSPLWGVRGEGKWPGIFLVLVLPREAGKKVPHGSDSARDAAASLSLTLEAGEANLLHQSVDRLVLWTWSFCASLSQSSSTNSREWQLLCNLPLRKEHWIWWDLVLHYSRV